VSKEGLWVCMLASVILFEVKLLMERLHKSPGNEEQRFQVALPPHQTISSAVVDAGEDMSSDVRSGSASTRGGLQKNGPPAPANVPVNKVPAPSRDLYIIFVTDCSVYQRWFAFSVWNSARIAGQTSPITWIRTGCKPGQRDNDKATAVELYPHADIIDMLPNDGKSGHTFVLEMGVPIAMTQYLNTSRAPRDDEVLAFIDADMIFLSPLRLDDLETRGIPAKKRKVRKNADGSLVGNKIGISAHYLLPGGLGSPFIMTVRDWRTLLPAWKFTRDGNRWGVDQIAFIDAAAKVGIYFNIYDHLMIAAPDTMPAGWDLVRGAIKRTASNVCATRQFGVQYGANHLPTNFLPTFMHVVLPWVETDGKGIKWGFSKYQVPPGFKSRPKTDGILDCRMPLFAEPPPSLLHSDRVEGWVICTVIHSLNSMLLNYKKVVCPGSFNTARSIKMTVPLDYTNILLDATLSDTPSGTDMMWIRKCTRLNC